MINVINPLMKSWYELLNDNLSVTVYRTNAPMSEKNDYVIIRFESESEGHIKLGLWTKPVVIVEVVTRHKNAVTDATANGIDSEISNLYRSLIGNNLPGQSGIQIANVYKQNVVGLDEYDGSEYLYRHITRYSHDIFQN